MPLGGVSVDVHRGRVRDNGIWRSFGHRLVHQSQCQGLELQLNLSVSNGKAKCTIAFPAVGNFNITATFANDPFFLQLSGSVLEEVVTANTPVFTSSSDTTAAVGAPFSFTVSANGKPGADITESGACRLRA